MIVLGVSPLDKDSTVSIVIDGRVAFAAAEERFSKVKLQDGFPLEALRAGLEYTGIRCEDIDIVAYPFFDWRRESELFTRNVSEERAYLKGALKNNTRQQIEAAIGKVPHRQQFPESDKTQ